MLAKALITISSALAIVSVAEALLPLINYQQFVLLSVEHVKYVYNDPTGWNNNCGYDGRSLMRLTADSESALRLIVSANTTVYQHPMFIGLQDIQTGYYLRHAMSVLHLNPLNSGGPEYDYGWQFQPRPDGNWDIYNAYNGGVYLGYDRETGSVLIVDAKDGRRSGWLKIPVCPDGSLTEGCGGIKQQLPPPTSCPACSCSPTVAVDSPIEACTCPAYASCGDNFFPPMVPPNHNNRGYDALVSTTGFLIISCFIAFAAVYNFILLKRSDYSAVPSP